MLRLRAIDQVETRSDFLKDLSQWDAFVNLPSVRAGAADGLPAQAGLDKNSCRAESSK